MKRNVKNTIILFLIVFQSIAGCYVGLNSLADTKIMIGSTVLFGRYKQDADKTEKNSELEWIVLDINDRQRALLVSKYVLDYRQYNPTASATAGDQTVSWGRSAARSWLNKEFINSAFSDEEQKAIILRIVDNSEEQSKKKIFGGDSTKDKVFLLSYAEVCKYFGNDQARIAYATGYARTKGAEKESNGKASWLTRSPDKINNTTTGVTAIDTTGTLYAVENHVAIGIRPAIWVDANSSLIGTSNSNIPTAIFSFATATPALTTENTNTTSELKNKSKNTGISIDVIFIAAIIVLFIIIVIADKQKGSKNNTEPKKLNTSVPKSVIGHKEKPPKSIRIKEKKRIAERPLPNYSNGHEYEFFVAEFLRRKGYQHVTVTRLSGDFGADIICMDAKGRKIAVQCKLYSRPVGYKAIQEVISGMQYYRCDQAMVVTNTTYTKQAVEAAQRMNIILCANIR